MRELNKFSGIEVFIAPGFDPLTATNMGDGVVALSNVDEEGRLHNVITGAEQLPALIAFLQSIVEAH